MKLLLETFHSYCLPCQSCVVLYELSDKLVYCEAGKQPQDTHLGYVCSDRYREPGADDDL